MASKAQWVSWFSMINCIGVSLVHLVYYWIYSKTLSKSLLVILPLVGEFAKPRLPGLAPCIIRFHACNFWGKQTWRNRIPSRIDIWAHCYLSTSFARNSLTYFVLCNIFCSTYTFNRSNV